MALDIEIDPTKITILRAAIDALESQLEVDFLPEFLRTFDEQFPIQNVRFYANEAKQQYEFAFGFGIKIDEDAEGEAQHLSIDIGIVIKPDKASGGKRPASYGGGVIVPVSAGALKELYFQGQFTSKAGGMWVLQCAVEEELSIGVSQLFAALSPDLSTLFPEELAIPLRQNLMLVITGKVNVGRACRFIFGAGLNVSFDLGQFPLLGPSLSAPSVEAGFGLELLVATDTFTRKEIKALSTALEEMGFPLRIKLSKALQELERGAHLVAELSFVGKKLPWYTPLKRKKSSPPFGSRVSRSVPRSSSEDFPITVGDNGAWLSVEQSAGPVHIRRLGLVYRDGAVYFQPEWTLSLGQLLLILDGASVRLPLPKGNAEFQVDGFGLEYSSDSLAVGGAFLRTSNAGYDDYAGLASIQLGLGGKGGRGAFGLSAIGAFAQMDSGPSLFLYAVLTAPLGGPPFFFVTGLSGGLGYNRDLEAPSIEGVPSFPLVAQAVQGTGEWNNANATSIVKDQLKQLTRYIRVEPEAGFLALGIKFTSFKLLDGFALLMLRFGKQFELNLLGLARLQVPFNSSKTVAVVELALQARFAPAEGLALIRGQLTSASYILSPSCKLTGGFAFATWFAGQHAGDFVLTMGGYHPKFNVPSHYPAVPRVGLDWKVGPLSLKGEAYFTLCAHAVMAGGHLEASFRSGPAWASFSMGANFLICWKPYAYDIEAYQHFKFGLGALSASLGATLGIWGPDFGGYVKLKVFLFSVKVKFGNQGKPAPKPIGWSDFRASFLPGSEEVCSIAVAEGLMREIKPESGTPLSIVNPRQFALVTDSVVPAREAYHPASGAPLTGRAFGIAPMAVKGSDLKSTQRLSIQRDGEDVEPDKFTISPVKRRMPAAMWGEPKVQKVKDEERLKFPEVNATRFVEETLVGLRLEPAEPPKAGDTDDLPVSALRFDPEIFTRVYDFESLSAFHAFQGDDGARRTEMQKTLLRNTARDAVLEALGFHPEEDVHLEPDMVDTFVFAPQVRLAA
ncbi:transcriptional regulator [Myxococcus xanthus]|uniref:DUF6603 domain-containing protein n=1 Tax=Myxococcus xanthus TaxID=34 RepID=UPI00112B10B3|nr:DUF6603 domain-containing protein [Myxococcus xanthus]QDE92721.1 transcriptional regulator [Myxococcus xanthus]